MTRTQLIQALDAFIESRPGFEPINYAGAPEAYRADYRRAYQHLKDARALLRAVSWRSIDADALMRAKHHRIDFKPSAILGRDRLLHQFLLSDRVSRSRVRHAVVGALELFPRLLRLRYGRQNPRHGAP